MTSSGCDSGIKNTRMCS